MGINHKIRQKVKCITIKELHKVKGYPIRTMCDILEIPHSSYYKWLNRKETEQEKIDYELCQIIQGYHDTFKGILGYRRMTLWINRLNHKHYNVIESLRQCLLTQTVVQHNHQNKVVCLAV